MIAELTTASGAAVCVVVGFVFGAGAVLMTLWLMQRGQKDVRYR